MNSVKPKVEIIDCEETKPEKLDASQDHDFTTHDLIPQENVTLRTKETVREQMLLISSKEPLTTDPKENSGKGLKILSVPEVNITSDVQNVISDSTSQSIQRSINEHFKNEKDIPQKSNCQGKTTVQEDLINTLISDSDSDNYEVETLDEDLLESEEFLRNGEKTECDKELIEILDDSDLSEVDAVEDAFSSIGL